MSFRPVYRLAEDDAGSCAEFLTPIRGSGLKRDGKPEATTSKGGITAQRLRHLDILLVKPWSVHVGPEQGVPIAAALDLFVPNPTSFIVQKLLIHSQDRRLAPENVQRACEYGLGEFLQAQRSS